ncbi:MAG: hypothetical protein SGJ24_03950 [Chloroflexota bacterium]|nr:hypothetical protein [Chloroflexota bacterium]
MSEQKRTTGSLPNIAPNFDQPNLVPTPIARSASGRGGEPPPLRPVPEGDSGRSRQSGGTGCGFITAITLALTAGLVLVGLLLPPINLADRLFGARYVPLTRDANAVREATLTLAVYGEDIGRDFAVALSSVPESAFAVGATSEDGSVRTAFQALPTSAEPISPLFTLGSSGTPPGAITLSLTLTDPNVPPDQIDLYGYTPADQRWRFIPSAVVGDALVATVAQLPPNLAALRIGAFPQTIMVSIAVDEVLASDAGSVATIVSPAGLQPTLTGDLTGSLAAGFDTAQRYLVAPSIRNYIDPRATDADTIVAVLGSSALSSRHLTALVELTRSGYDGIVIDYRDLPAALRPAFSAFLTQLGAALRADEKLLIVVVPPAINTPSGWETGAYDWQTIGAAADAVQIVMPSDPAAFAPGADRLVEAMIRWAVDQISRQKVLIGMTALSQRQVGDGFTPITLEEALSALGNVALEIDLAPGDTLPPGTPFTARLDGYPAQVGSAGDDQPYIDYLDSQGGAIARAWVVTGDALRARIERLAPFSLAGVSIDDLNNPGVAPDMMQSLLDYSLGLPAQPTPFNIDVRWTVETVNDVIDTVTSALDAPFAVTIAAPPGYYAVNAALVSGGIAGALGGDSAIEVAREGAQVAVFAATATPTPSPTPTSTPTPAPTAAPQQSAPAQPNGGGQPAFQPGAGSIRTGQFEYGGHVTNTATGAVGAMQRAGMTWMKVQFRYGPGADPGIAGTWISQARGSGFKILIGIVGSPGDLGSGGADYVRQYAVFAGQVAGLGPDAIEIWNEPNLDREWPNGQISGASYASMLSQSYQAIKSANSSVVVISAAPAPTGAEAAYPGAVLNDDNWLRQFVEAGGLNSADCVGAHYNEGTVPASASSGDQRDNYYTRYFPTTIDTYWNIIGGAKPLCFTELGYLTPEGYPPLDPYFAWGANTTVAQQAAWLAEAAAYASQTGRVRLMIVWNIDYEFYGSDPMAGYAIVRPGGGCPACDALAAAR